MNDREKEIVSALRFNDCIRTNCTECVCEEWCGDTRSLQEEAANLIESQSAEIDRLAQENAELRDQVYNLTLYLTVALNTFDDDDDTKCAFMFAMLNEFDGMPGYNPAILEGKHGTQD